MKTKIISFSILAVTAFAVRLNAQQDIHFSQFYSVPLLVNPGTAGLFEGDVRLITDYRSQWKSITTPYTSMSAMVDFPIAKGKAENGSFFGGGLSFYNDKAGDSKFTSGQYSLSFSYILEVARDQFLSLGLQGGLLQKSVNFGSLYWDSQFTGLEFNTDLPSNEQQPADQFSRADLAFGVYYFNASNDNYQLFAGIAGGHLTAPNISFLGVKEQLYRKFTIHGGAQFITTNVAFIPNILFIAQGPNMIFNLGTDVKFILREQSKVTGFVDEMSLALGAYYRAGDALMGGLRFNYAGLTVSGMYDLNTSELSAATGGKGAYEVMIGYRAGFGTGKGKATKFF
jgi:type IX secretion system PorP/SprF family membrane protein